MQTMGDLLSWLRSFAPVSQTVSRRERFFSCAGAIVGLLLAEWICRQALGEATPWFIAPMGASAVLLFAVPSSPLAQPWAIVGGNVMAALVGVTCAKLVTHPGLAAALAVGIAIGVMFQFKCLHPPGGAVALMSVLGGPGVMQFGYRFALWPVAIDSLVLVTAAILFNVAMGRRYPHRAHPHVLASDPKHVVQPAEPIASPQLGVTLDDLNEVLRVRGELIDVSNDDLEEIFMAAELRAYRRWLGQIGCSDLVVGDEAEDVPSGGGRGRDPVADRKEMAEAQGADQG
ncbi:MAG TPA: HPP family protein [Aromatoleum sp.]|uniref:HPP family protein n=1 Tax=Aromatoleum sp. TaxID=2307007 RepID=UPI002B47B877|nr:HPP family protein [Aromatoleum sp.]HJV28812.1 HPP family protein [Aromatoleum sp.]